MTNPARVTTIQNILESPGSGRPIVGRRVSIRLIVPGWIDGGTREKIRETYAVTDSTGMWSVPLEVTADIDPPGTYYTVRENAGADPLYFNVPYSVTPLPLRSCLITNPAAPTPAGGPSAADFAALEAALPQTYVTAPRLALDTDGVYYPATAAGMRVDSDGTYYFNPGDVAVAKVAIDTDNVPYPVAIGA